MGFKILFSLAFAAGLSAYAAQETWRGKMNEVSLALSETIPFLFPDPGQDTKGLAEKVKKLYELTKDLDVKADHMVKSKDYDPALPYLAAGFKESVARAHESLQDGHADYAKAVLKGATGYCVACHTRTKSGAEFPLMGAYTEPLKAASWVTRIEFLAASRQFDGVLNQVMTKLSDTGTPGISALDLERASNIAMSIAIRVKKDPVKARLLAQAVAKSPNASFSMKEGAKVWEKDISQWQREKTKKYPTDESLIQGAREMIKQSEERTGTVGGHDEVKFLRASVLMHDLLRQFPDSGYRAEALYLIGRSYTTLLDVATWNLNEQYFLACVKEVPHTSLAEKCATEFEKSVTIGYSGSSGTHIPGGVKRHLERVKAEAKVL